MPLEEIARKLRWLADDLNAISVHDCNGGECSRCYPNGKASRLRELADEIDVVRRLLQ